MKLNSILRNESKLTVRNIRFNITVLIYIGILTIGAILAYNSLTKNIYAIGLNVNSTLGLYIYMAIAQAVLLMFIVPSLTSTLISSEREKQTLDILLSTKLTPFQIIFGKIASVILKVVMLIVATLPVYTIATLIGGVKVSHIVQLIIFFIVNTIFVSAIGIFMSTIFTTSKVSTVMTYLTVLFIYVGIVIISIIIFALKQPVYSTMDNSMPVLIYLSPVSGFIALISNQLGSGIGGWWYPVNINITGMDSYYISIAIQLTISSLLIWAASVKLNPLNKIKKNRVKKNKKVNKG